MGETLSSETVSTKIERIAKLAREYSDRPLTTLAHHVDVEWLREAYRRTRKDGARGIDGQSAEQYAERLDENLKSLLDRAKSGVYRAPPVRRVHIPKGDGSQTRPIGIPTFEDKVLQRAVAMVLEAIYEEEFHDFSYGFRPNRSAHQACEALQNITVKMAGGWVLEVDIKKFFDTLDHERLREILSRRVRDGVILRLIGKWLNAGVMEGLVLSHAEVGTPQAASSRRSWQTSICTTSWTSGLCARCRLDSKVERSSCATQTTSSLSSRGRMMQSVCSTCCRRDSASTD